MKTFGIILCACVFLAVCVHGQGAADEDNTHKPPKPKHTVTTEQPTTHTNPTTHKTETTTSEKPTTHTATTPKTEHTTHQTTPKTHEQTTGTPKPTTHENQTTHKTEHTTGTERPTTATPVPTPAPGQPITYSVNYTGTNNPCILVRTDAKFNFTYTRKDNKTASVIYNLTNYSNGTCQVDGNNNTQKIYFYIGKEALPLRWTFERNETNQNQYYVKDMTMMFTISDKIFPNISTADKGKEFSATNNSRNYVSGADQGYRCRNQPDLTFQSNVTRVTVSMRTTQLEVQAFRPRTQKSTTFYNMQWCRADRTSNIVPIAVGAALAGLVIIVLIAYLIGRRRNKKGYESV